MGAPRPAQCGDASGTGVFDTAARAWDSERMRCIDPGLEDFFPQLTGPDEVQQVIFLHVVHRLHCNEAGCCFQHTAPPE